MDLNKFSSNDDDMFTFDYVSYCEQNIVTSIDGIELSNVIIASLTIVLIPMDQVLDYEAATCSTKTRLLVSLNQKASRIIGCSKRGCHLGLQYLSRKVD